MQSRLIREIVKTMRDNNAPTIDGSYVLCTDEPISDPGVHPAYTPAQIEAERIAKEQRGAKHVCFVKGEAAPFWFSPFRRKERDGVPYLAFTVARSREDRRNGLEYEFSLSEFFGMAQQERAQYCLDVLRKALADLLIPA